MKVTGISALSAHVLRPAVEAKEEPMSSQIEKERLYWDPRNRKLNERPYEPNRRLPNEAPVGDTGPASPMRRCPA
jgi:hypothetical protein